MNQREKSEKINVLTIVIDLNTVQWGKRSQEGNQGIGIKFTEMMNHLFVFINTYLMTKHHNRISIIFSGSKRYEENRLINLVKSSILLRKLQKMEKM